MNDEVALWRVISHGSMVLDGGAGVGYQNTVIYRKCGGEVLKVVGGCGITRRSDLLRHVPGADLSEIGFYYEDGGIDVNEGKDVVKFFVDGSPPMVVGEGGRVKWCDAVLSERRKVVDWAREVKIDFDAGLGDQVLQLEAVKQLAEEKPGLKIRVGMRECYRDIYPYLENAGVYETAGLLSPGESGSGYLSMATRYLCDPRGDGFGKASLYGLMIGVERVSQSIKFNMSAKEMDEWALKGGVDLGAVKRPLLVVHIKSGSGTAKSWYGDEAERLCQMWQRETGGSVCLLGARVDYAVPGGRAFFLSRGARWSSTGAVVLGCDVFVGVDSGPMHLARAGGVRSIILWGGTSPGNILGREEDARDVRVKLPCIERVCYFCNEGHHRCMRMIKGGDVFRAVVESHGGAIGL